MDFGVLLYRVELARGIKIAIHQVDFSVYPLKHVYKLETV